MSKTTNPDKTTGKLTATTQIHAVSAVGNNFLLYSDGTNTASLIVYDVAASGDAAVGNEVIELHCSAGTKMALAGGLNYRFTKGIYCALSGTGAYFIAHTTVPVL